MAHHSDISIATMDLQYNNMIKQFRVEFASENTFLEPAFSDYI